MSDVTTQPANVPMVVTDRATAPPDGTIVVTPRGLPNIVIRTMTPLYQVGVRSVRTYLQALVGLLALALAGAPVAAGIGVMVPPGDFALALKTAAGLAVAPAVVSALMNLAELFARIDETAPKLRA